MFVLTKAVNDYNQCGDYLETVFSTSPTLADLAKYLYNTTIENLEDEQILLLTHIKRGGGRQNTEHEWYFLEELKSGERYKHSNG